MPLQYTTLATGLKNIGFPTNATELAAGWKTAFNNFLAEAQELPTSTPAVPDPAALSLFETAIKSLANINNTAVQAATIIKDACKAYWSGTTALLMFPSVVLPPAGPFATLPTFMLTPASETAFVSTLQTAFAINLANKSSAVDSYDAIAQAIATPQAGATFLDTNPSPVLHTVI